MLTRFWAALRRHRTQIVLAFRVTVAALLALGAAQALSLPLPLWAVLTAIIVTQVSVGRSLKVTIDYLIGTVGGAVYGAAIGVLVPHASEAMLLLALALAVAPLALLAAVQPSLSVGTITAVIVILLPAITHASPVASATDRVLEVSLGAFIGFVVSFLILPANAHRLAVAEASATLEHMADALGELLAGLAGGRDVAALHRIQDHIGRALERLGTICGEAERERAARLAAGPDTAPLLRTLLRLRHDLVIVGRVTLAPLPEPLLGRIRPPLARVEAASAAYMRGCAAALLARQPPPALDAVTAALAAYGAEVTALRNEGLTRSLSGDAAERFFALGFGLEQIHRNFAEFGARAGEWAETPKRRRRGTSPQAPPAAAPPP